MSSLRPLGEEVLRKNVDGECLSDATATRYRAADGFSTNAISISTSILDGSRRDICLSVCGVLCSELRGYFGGERGSADACEAC